MKPKLSKSIQRRRRHLSFNPSSQFIAEAVEEYLKGGGKITQLEAQTENSKQDSWLNVDDTQEADEFLNEL
jgi:hypothetical protein